MKTHPLCCARWLLSILAFLACFKFSAGRGTASPAPILQEGEAKIAARKAAMAAFKQDDPSAAMAILSRNVRVGSAEPHEKLQLAREISDVGSDFNRDRDNQRARKVALLAISVLKEAHASFNSRDASASMMLAGQLYDHLVGEHRLAIEHYERVLAAGSAQPIVAQRLAHLKAIEESSRRKDAANELLRQRAAAVKP